MNRPIRVTLVEDHPEYREVIELTLDKAPDIELISQFGTSERALLSLRNHPKRKSPDVILLDLSLPGMHGSDAIPLFIEALPSAKIIILTQSDREADVLKAISQGAAGYLLKSSTLKQITEGISTVMTGGASLDAGVAKYILTTLKQTLPKSEPQHILSERESEVLSLLAEGLVKKEIAERLGISTSTVITHVAHIYDKLGAANAPSAVYKAHRLGLFPSPEN